MVGPSVCTFDDWRGVRGSSDVSVLGVDSMKRVLNLMVTVGTRTIALVALSLACCWPDRRGIRPGRDHRRLERHRHQRAAAAHAGRERHRHPPAVGHQLRNGDPLRRTIHDSRHARRRSLQRDRHVQRHDGHRRSSRRHRKTCRSTLGIGIDLDLPRARDRRAGNRDGLGAPSIRCSARAAPAPRPR